MLIPLFLSASFLIGFGVSSKKDKFRLYNGLLLMAALGCFALVGLFLLAGSALFSSFIILIPILLTAGLFLSPILLIHNGIVMAKREGMNITHSLSLILGVGCLLLLGGMFVVTYFSVSEWLMKLYAFILLIAATLFVLLLVFLLDTMLYSRASRTTSYDYILVLGAGLLDGSRVSPLLASRLDKALKIYKRNPQAKFIVSGGKGSDESISEAEAMARYLTQHGVPSSRILLENQSTTTLENMKFSKQLMDSEKASYRCVFVTNNFHVFRAGMYANQIQLKADGAGSKTAGYYLPCALLREFIAILWRYRYAFGIYVLFLLSVVLR